MSFKNRKAWLYVYIFSLKLCFKSGIFYTIDRQKDKTYNLINLINKMKGED